MGRDHSTWLVLLFLLAGIAVPAGAVLWFMNAAASSEAASARQSVTEAYRGQLRFIRDRIDHEWELRASELAKQTGRGTPEDFARIVRAGVADSVILLRADGTLIYPSAPKPPAQDPAADRLDSRAAQNLERQRNWQAAAGAYSAIAKSNTDVSLAARAAQAQVRVLLQIDRAAAANAIFEYFSHPPLASAADLQGRLIAADEYLLVSKLLSRRDPRRAAALQRLSGWMNDYKTALPSSQRLFLMNELATEGISFPTYQAEKLAAQVLDVETIAAGSGLEATRVPDIYGLPGTGGRTVALYRKTTVLSLMQAALKEVDSTPGVSFEMLTPGASPRDEAIAAGPILPGWQIAFSLQNEQAFADAARRRTNSYFIVGYAVIAALCATGLLLSQIVRRQMRLTRLKTDLVATVSHELKTPLASMRLLVDGLLEDVSPNPRKTREYLQLISDENMRLTRLIENFLTFSRIERRRQSFEFQRVDPVAVADAAAAAVRERFCADLQIEPDLPPIYADEDALITVLLNLLDNAYKYTPAEKQIALRANSENGFVVFAVEDNGIGIAPRDRKRIFRKFYQVDRRLARETGGCGLGLSIVDYIVRAHRGSVRVQSRPGAGSTFFVAIPYREQAKEAAA
jgi:signal transduction histidine kinase